MYRLTVSPRGVGVVRITHKASKLWDEVRVVDQRSLVLALRNFIRDLLCLDYGKSWHKAEQHHLASIKRSIISAVKRGR